MTTDSRKLARAIEKRLHLIADPSIRKDMVALCEHLIAALDERDAAQANHRTQCDVTTSLIADVARLQAENERYREALRFYAHGHRGLPCPFCEDGGLTADAALKENHGKQ